MAKERRRHTRLNFKRGLIQYETLDGSKSGTAGLLDVSEGGLRFNVDHVHLTLGEKIQMLIALGTKTQPMRLNGTVQHIFDGTPGIGTPIAIEFTDLTPDQARNIKAAVLKVAMAKISGDSSTDEEDLPSPSASPFRAPIEPHQLLKRLPLRFRFYTLDWEPIHPRACQAFARQISTESCVFSGPTVRGVKPRNIADGDILAMVAFQPETTLLDGEVKLPCEPTRMASNPAQPGTNLYTIEFLDMSETEAEQLALLCELFPE